jgi:spermidine/putrescine transport system substrate-binding protein/spermidine/putrescine transport system permease protein
MKKFYLLLCSVLFAAVSFTGCGNSSDGKETLTVLNYGKYFDPDALKQFEEETGIRVEYEEYESPEEMYTKYKAGSIDYDLLCTSDYMIQKLIEEEEVLEMNHDNIPSYQNIDQNIIDASASFDPTHRYTLPYFYGTVGILYNTDEVDASKTNSWDILWDSEYEGRIIMENSVRDCFLVPLKRLGYSLNTTNEQELNEALTMLMDQKPLIYAYFVDETGDEMAAGNASLAVVYSGEAAYAKSLSDNLAYSVPKEGSNLWIDSWFIPKTCKNTENAEKFLDFLCREDIARKNFDYVYYATPNTAVYNNLDDAIKKDTIIFPDQSVLENCEVYTSLNEEGTNLYNRLWKELKSD